MLLDYAESMMNLLANLTALLFCLFQYISRKRKSWLYAIAFFLSNILSSYFWTFYLIIMGDWPNSNDLMTYFGWNLGFLMLLLLTLHMKTKEERRYFHPLMLLPIPLNLYQLTIYNTFGRVINNTYQVIVCTAVACSSLQSLCWYWNKRKEGVRKPYAAFAAFLFVTFSFGMWTFSCFDEPFAILYYPLSMLSSVSLLFLAWAISRTYAADQEGDGSQFDKKYQTALKISYLLVVVGGSVVSILLGTWMRDILTAGQERAADSHVYNIISVVLFVISLNLVSFASAVIFVVCFGNRAIENNKLREAKRMAEQANAAKSEFLANMSHEIRTPINAVMGMNEMILRESLQARDLLPKERELIREIFANICGYAGNIESAGKNLLAIINDILDISKIEAGKLEINEVRYNLSSVLNDVSNMIIFKAQDKRLAFHVDVDERLPECLYGDEVRVRQIMTNLLNNAVKYTNAGSVTLTVRGDGENAYESGQTVNLTVSVRDTGIGIKPEDIGKLFEKFERMDLKINSSVEGSGLGLAISKSLAAMMGGDIQVESTYGVGSVFTVTLPQKVLSNEAVGNFREKFDKNMRETKARREVFRAPDAHILVVDDTRLNITVVEGLLKNTGIEIDAVLSGAESVELARTIHYDLILMDQRMPQMDGTEALHLIQAQEDGLNRDTPVICLTADAISGAKQRYMAEGFTDYLTKPVNGYDLEKMMLKYLPTDKVKTVSPKEQPDADEKTAGRAVGGILDFSTLRAAGIQPETGLRYCQGDEKLYRSILLEYAQNAGKKQEDLQKFYEAADWKNYGILVHSVKSSSRLIGAASLSEAAAKLESAAGEGNGTEIQNGHDSLMTRYKKLTEEILRLNIQEADTYEPDSSDDDMMEFLPKET